MKIEYHEINIKRILAYFVENFKMPQGTVIQNYEFNYDPNSGKVIFKLYVETKKEEKE